MSLFLESIALRDGQLQALEWHCERMNRTAKAFGFRAPSDEQITDAVLAEMREQKAENGLWRVSLHYRERLDQLRFVPYQIRQVRHLRLVSLSENIYPYKFVDRAVLEAYRQDLSEQEEPLFLLKNRLTDTSYTNLVLEREAQFYTPRRPLLLGTKRAALLAAGKLVESDISPDDLRPTDRLHLINAMMDIGDCVLSADKITA